MLRICYIHLGKGKWGFVVSTIATLMRAKHIRQQQQQQKRDICTLKILCLRLVYCFTQENMYTTRRIYTQRSSWVQKKTEKKICFRIYVLALLRVVVYNIHKNVINAQTYVHRDYWATHATTTTSSARDVALRGICVQMMLRCPSTHTNIVEILFYFLLFQFVIVFLFGARRDIVFLNGRAEHIFLYMCKMRAYSVRSRQVCWRACLQWKCTGSTICVRT